ncbi:hypothetical protein HHK36_023633 [Tetracentron sinense]|uniref:RING-type E3 ubiquitin transferase n=1 Tax=Tetracentron sinense TaxID=13715 RepID=A0A834YLQ5_TETSI|nr:hypothetical protein HHK36_023633 [Tetracentron sinense]
MFRGNLDLNSGSSDMGSCENSDYMRLKRKIAGSISHGVVGFCFVFALFQPAMALRPLRERARSWGDEHPESGGQTYSMVAAAATGKTKMWEVSQQEDARVNELVVILGYKVSSSDIEENPFITTLLIHYLGSKQAVGSQRSSQFQSNISSTQSIDVSLLAPAESSTISTTDLSNSMQQQNQQSKTYNDTSYYDLRVISDGAIDGDGTQHMVNKTNTYGGHFVRPGSLDHENDDAELFASWRLFIRRNENDLGPYDAWNITGTYRGYLRKNVLYGIKYLLDLENAHASFSIYPVGTWSFLDFINSSSRFPDFRKSSGISVFELVSTPTKIMGVHYVQGVVIFHDAFGNEHEIGGAQLRVEGVHIWPFKQLRMVANCGRQEELGQEDDYFLANPYHLLGVFSSQVFQESPRDKIWRRKYSPFYDMEKQCNLEFVAQISRVSSTQNDGDRERYHLDGLMESSAVDDDGECFSSIVLNGTSVNIEVYYNKAVNYTLMVTFVSFLQVLLLIRQMEHSNTQSGAAKVSILMIGQQAIMDAYLCLLHLTAGILVESLFNAFATAAFFKFVVFSIFEMRYLLAIWKANRPFLNNGEGWETMRRELSVLYSRFYGMLLGGILVMYEFRNFLRPIILLMYSFWAPQIITNVVRDSRKPLHPHYILGMTVTRLAIPLYVFGCPKNFMRIEHDKNWCICLCVFMGLQASILLLQHYLGSRWFIPHQILPEKYNYYRRFDQDTNDATDCVICMTAIDLIQRSNDCMVTPCDHFFHSGCLQRWMDIKMECPTCRRPLPPA